MYVCFINGQPVAGTGAWLTLCSVPARPPWPLSDWLVEKGGGADNLAIKISSPTQISPGRQTLMCWLVSSCEKLEGGKGNKARFGESNCSLTQSKEQPYPARRDNQTLGDQHKHRWFGDES